MKTDQPTVGVFSNKILGSIFVAIAVTYIILNLPSSILGKQLRNQGMLYSGSSGSIWNAEFKNLLTIGKVWQKAQITPHLFPLITGNLSAGYIVSNPDENITGDINTDDDGNLHLTNLHGMSNIDFTFNNQPIPAMISFNSEELVLDQSGNCQNGSFNVKTDILDHFRNDFGFDFPPLSGQGNCQSSIVSIIMQSETNGINITFRGEYSGSRQIGQLAIQLPQTIQNNQQITSKLQALGFENTAGLWQVDTKVELK